jgi:hypothetical protein
MIKRHLTGLAGPYKRGILPHGDPRQSQHFSFTPTRDCERTSSSVSNAYRIVAIISFEQRAGEKMFN